MSSRHQRIKWRRNIAENFNRLSTVHERYRRQTTDGRTTTYSEREHEFTFAKSRHTTKQTVIIIFRLLNIDTRNFVHDMNTLCLKKSWCRTFYNNFINCNRF